LKNLPKLIVRLEAYDCAFVVAA